MVVGEDNRRCVALERGFHHLPRVHTGTVDSAVEYLVETDDPVAVVQEQAGKDLLFSIGQFQPEKPFTVAAIVYRFVLLATSLWIGRLPWRCGVIIGTSDLQFR